VAAVFRPTSSRGSKTRNGRVIALARFVVSMPFVRCALSPCIGRSIIALAAETEAQGTPPRIGFHHRQKQLCRLSTKRGHDRKAAVRVVRASADICERHRFSEHSKNAAKGLSFIVVHGLVA
jgi:hypothetical protein